MITLHILVSILLATPTIVLAENPFDGFLQELRKEAINQGIRPTALDSVLKGLVVNPKVLALYRRQPEKRQDLSSYLKQRVSTTRITLGQKLLAEHQLLLEQVASEFGVQSRFIVALWGSESSYGRNMGDFSVVRSLATLAHGSKRKDYFRRELLVALHILDQGHIHPSKMLGSWAGAMGQCQFMPWSYDRRAIDFDQDGRRDIWFTQADVFASIANYLAAVGWKNDQTWGREVTLPPNFNSEFTNKKMELQEWQNYGVRRLNGTALPTRKIEAKLIRPTNANGRSFLVYDNYDVLLKWNRSHHFAIAIGTLADRLRPSNVSLLKNQ
jgi:membrane-bound lytic murein transglycosylase B